MGNFESVAVIDVLVKPGDTHRHRHAAGHARNRQGHHGCAVHRQGRGREGARRQGRQGVHRRAGGDGARREGAAAAGCSAAARRARCGRHRPRLPRRAAPAAAPRRKKAPSKCACPTWAISIPCPSSKCMVKPGDSVDFDTPLVTLETDKATMDVPSTAKGVVEKVHVTKGGNVAAGRAGGDGQGHRCRGRSARGRACGACSRRACHGRAAPRTQRRRACSSRSPAARGGLPAIDEASFGSAHAGPSVRKFARELGVNLGSVRGSGEKGRILLDDVKAFVKLVMSGGVALARAGAGAAQGAQLRSVGVRRSRGQAAQPRAEDFRPAPAGGMDQHSACHAVRRGGHHRARSRCVARSRTRPPLPA